MAAAKHLPIYREAYRLVAHLHAATKKAPRDLRHTLVQRLLDEAVECCVDIADANRATGPERVDRINRLASRVARVETLLAVAMEQRCMSTGAAAVAMERTDSLARQTHGWARHTRRPGADTPKTAGHGLLPEPDPST